MRIQIPYRYTEQVIPKRCRKLRPVTREATIKLTIHEVTSDTAPVAIVEHDRDWNEEGQIPTTTVYRWWKRRLYRLAIFQRYSGGPHEGQTAQEFVADTWPHPQELPSWQYGQFASRRQRQAGFRRWASSILFIDGERWKRAGEPRYVVMTFGLGCNHGLGYGTDLFTANYYNSNISRDRYFRIDQFQEAVAETGRIATARGDTKALPVLEKQQPDTFDILIPEAVRLNPHREHGTGCAFINKMERVIESVKSPMAAGLIGMALAFRE